MRVQLHTSGKGSTQWTPHRSSSHASFWSWSFFHPGGAIIQTLWIPWSVSMLYANCILSRHFSPSGLFSSILYLRVAVFCSFSLLWMIALCEYTTIYLSIQLLIGLWVASRLASWRLAAMNIHVHIFWWTYVYIFQMLSPSYVLGINPTFRDVLCYLYVAGSDFSGTGSGITAFMWLKEIRLEVSFSLMSWWRLGVGFP